MPRKSLEPLPAECEELREQLENWRRTREKRSRVPEAVWETAARLAQEYGTNRISRALRLNHAALKKRVNGDGEAAATAAPTESRPLFVELGVCSSTETSADYVLEVEKPSGTRLRVELKGAHIQELAAVMKAFCSDVP